MRQCRQPSSILTAPSTLLLSSPPNPSPSSAATHGITTRSTCTSTHPFFKTLTSRPRFLTKYFTQNFLSSAPVCDCQRFPIHAAKLPLTSPSSSPALPPELSHLCLVCARSFTSRGYACGRLHHLWTRHLEDEWAAYYHRFYSPEEESHFLRKENLGDRVERLQFTMARISPLLKARGGIPCETETKEEEDSSEDESQEEEDPSEDEAWDSEVETGSILGEDEESGDWSMFEEAAML
jgi:hypothetical protein